MGDKLAIRANEAKTLAVRAPLHGPLFDGTATKSDIDCTSTGQDRTAAQVIVAAIRARDGLLDAVDQNRQVATEHDYRLITLCSRCQFGSRRLRE
ncbi:hypothetical protein WL94_23385 [Burkholderia cepacia]|nr:hypothetical protein WL94_23385 [Burkholderia cepacia]